LLFQLPCFCAHSATRVASPACAEAHCCRCICCPATCTQSATRAASCE
jgi:hypothetical protein